DNGGALRSCCVPTRFRRSVQALVALAVLIHRLLERVFLRQGLKRRDLELGGGRLARELQERRIVGSRRNDPVAPGLDLGRGNTRCALRVGRFPVRGTSGRGGALSCLGTGGRAG